MSVGIDGHNQGLRASAEKLEVFIANELRRNGGRVDPEVVGVLQRLEGLRLQLLKESEEE